MSYLNQSHDPRRRVTAIVAVGAVHAVLAAGLLTGLKVNFPKIDDIPFVGTTIELDDPLPPEPSPTTPPEQADYVPQTPETKLDLTEIVGPERVEVDEVSTDLTYYPTGPGVEVTPNPPSPPPPAFTPKRATPNNSSSNWISNSDYPRRDLVDGHEGSVGYRLVIGTNGRVSSCELTRPSGFRGLDSATCRLITGRARFDPATDETGAKVLGTYSGTVTWDIPD